MSEWTFPKDVPAVSPELLTLAVQRGSIEAAGRGRMAPIAGQYAPSLWLEDDETGELQYIQFTNHPQVRFLTAVMDLAPSDRDKAFALALRASSLLDALRDRRFKPYTQDTDDPEQIEFDEVLAEVVATIPYRLHDGPKMQEILREVRRRESQGPQADLFGGG